MIARLLPVILAWSLLAPQIIIRNSNDPDNLPGAPPAGGATPCTDAQTAGTAVYIRQGASGTGTGADWTNAVTTPPTTLVRGKTYCIADTTTGFGQWKITTHSASTTWTYIVKATVADHGTSTGWVSTYGDGQAIFTGNPAAEGVFDYAVNGSGYLEVNGNGTRATCGAIPALSGASGAARQAAQTGCGFKFVSTSHSGQSFNWHSNGSNLVAKYIETEGIGGTSLNEYTVDFDQQGYAFWGDPTVVTLARSYIHNTCTASGAAPDTIFEGNYFANNRANSTGTCHGNIVFVGFSNTNVTFRYNYVDNYDAEGFFVSHYGGVPSGIFVYGNVFQSPNTGGVEEYSRGFEIREGASSAYSNVQVHNNTFYGLENGGISDRANEGGAGCTGCAATNNISVLAGNGCNGATPGSGCSFTYTTNTDDSTTSRFVSAGANFHLTGALGGTSLASTYNTDILGNTRGADGTWDRGAYEYCSGGCSTLSLKDATPKGIWLALARALAPAARQETVRVIPEG